MHQRTLRVFIMLAGTFVFLLATGASALSAELLPRQQASTPPSTPLTQEMLEQFWQEMYPNAEQIGVANVTNVYTHELLAKASPDECFNGIGVPIAITDTVPECVDGQPKVNEAYVWGLTDYEETIWFGTAPNVHCLVIGAFLGAPIPLTTDSYTCEYGQGPYSPPLPEIIGDWRPPSLYIYDNENAELTDISLNGLTGYPFVPSFISNTLGIRSAATFGDYIFFAGPAFTPTQSINIFLYNAATRTYVGSKLLLGYGNIRKWLEVDGVLYTAVGTEDGGAVLRYTGNPASANPAERFTFVEVGTLDADGAELALHEGRLFVNTWPTCFCDPGVVAGLWMSPPIPNGGLTAADADDWEQVFGYDEYEPDPVIAATYGGGALYSYQGDLFWGTMHVPFLATLAHLSVYGPAYGTDRPDPNDILLAMTGSQRSITIFQGRNFGTPNQEIEIAYGMPELPAFDVDTLTWVLSPTLLGPPSYGLSGFDNMFNNYTWSMAEYDGQLFVGTMDWSYLLEDIFDTLLNVIELPLDLEISLPDATVGADLYRFYATDQPAVTESLSGVGNYSSYGVRNLLGRDDGLYLGMANPMNLLTDLTDDKPEGGWELIRMTRNLITLTVGLEGTGSGSVASNPLGIDCGASCSAEFDLGMSVILTPTASVTSTFTGWSGACFGLGPCTVELLEASVVTANFTINTYPLTVNLAGNGSGHVSSLPVGLACSLPSCTTNFDVGTEVSLSAIGFSGSSFEEWDGACNGTDECQITIAPGTTVVTATFNQNVQQANLTVEGLPFVGSILTFTASLNLTPILECTWDFGDGESEECNLDTSSAGVGMSVNAINDTSVQTTHSYAQSGVYVVTVTASNNAGTMTVAQQINIQTPTAETPIQQPNGPGELYFPYLNR